LDECPEKAQNESSWRDAAITETYPSKNQNPHTVTA